MLKNLFVMTIVSLFALVGTAQTTSIPASDAEIAEVLMTVNDAEIDSSRIAGQRAQSEEVKAFAKLMVQVHKASSKETKTLIRKEKMKNKGSDLSQTLQGEAKNLIKSLKDADTAAFDKTYVDQQVAMHQQALSLMNETLIPNTKNADLKAHLEKTRVATIEHLANAKNLQAKTK